MEHRIGMEIRVLSKYMGRYLDDIHGIDCMLSGRRVNSYLFM